jgi:hypothetical protein
MVTRHGLDISFKNHMAFWALSSVVEKWSLIFKYDNLMSSTQEETNKMCAITYSAT